MIMMGPGSSVLDTVVLAASIGSALIALLGGAIAAIPLSFGAATNLVHEGLDTSASLRIGRLKCGPVPAKPAMHRGQWESRRKTYQITTHLLYSPAISSRICRFAATFVRCAPW